MGRWSRPIHADVLKNSGRETVAPDIRHASTGGKLISASAMYGMILGGLVFQEVLQVGFLDCNLIQLGPLPEPSLEL